MQPKDIVGQILGHYRVIRPVGYGGMATVFLAEDIHLHREVAVKVFQPAPGKTGDFLRRFAREARVLAQLDHPHILRIYDYGEWDTLAYLVMPYLAKGSLKDLLQARHILPPAEACHLITQMLSALQYAHERGLIHRDIKPGNMLFKAENTLVLSDFGLVKVLAVGTHNQSLVESTSQTGRWFAGTPGYMAPEQATGEAVLLSDIYSVGVVLYQMLTGRLPFIADNVMGMLMQHRLERPRPLYEINPHISPQLGTVVLRALEKDPARRYQNAADFSQSLLVAQATRASSTEIATPLPDRSELSLPLDSLATHADTAVNSSLSSSSDHNDETLKATSATMPESALSVSSLPTRRLRSRSRSTFMLMIAPLIVIALLLSLSLSPLGGVLFSILHNPHHGMSHITPTTIPLAQVFAHCPPAGQVHTPVMSPLPHSDQQNIVYVANAGSPTGTHGFASQVAPSLAAEGYPNADSIPTDAPTFSILERYDVTTRNHVEIASFAQVSITNAQLSSDGQWVLFTTNTSKQSAIQMIRLDGQGLQTLYCTSTGPFNNVLYPPDGTSGPFNNIVWSPDRQSAVLVSSKSILDSGFILSLLSITSGTLRTLYHTTSQRFQGVEWFPDQKSVALSVSTPYPNNTATVSLVNVVSRTVQTALSFKDVFVPGIGWLDNMHIYLVNETEFADRGPDTLYMLDLGRGLNQHSKDLITIFQQSYSSLHLQALASENPCWDQTASNNGTKLFISQCTELGYSYKASGLTAIEGPSSISVQPTTGGPMRTIYSSKTLAVTAIASVSSTSIVFLIDNVSNVTENPVDTSQNGLWKVNTNGTGLTRLTADQDERQSSITSSAQGNNIYAIEEEHSGADLNTTTETLFLGSPGANKLQTISSVSGGTTLSLVGWTNL